MDFLLKVHQIGPKQGNMSMQSSPTLCGFDRGQLIASFPPSSFSTSKLPLPPCPLDRKTRETVEDRFAHVAGHAALRSLHGALVPRLPDGPPLGRRGLRRLRRRHAAAVRGEQDAGGETCGAAGFGVVWGLVGKKQEGDWASWNMCWEDNARKPDTGMGATDFQKHPKS